MFFSDLNALVLIVNKCTLHYMYIIEIKLKKNWWKAPTQLMGSNSTSVEMDMWFEIQLPYNYEMLPVIYKNNASLNFFITESPYRQLV
jgi:hypothetical protein